MIGVSAVLVITNVAINIGVSAVLVITNVAINMKIAHVNVMVTFIMDDRALWKS